MINLKKSLIAVFIFSSVVLSLFGAPSNNSNEENTVRNSAESSIILGDEGDAAFESAVAENSGKKGSSSISIFIRMIVVLIIVVGLIYLVFYFVKKKTNYIKNEDDYLRRAAYINIAPGKTVEVITLIDKAYLIGVTEENITLLGEIKDDELIKAMNITADKKNNTKKPSTFSDVLDMFLVKGNKQKSVFDESASEIKVENVVDSEDSATKDENKKEEKD